MFYTNDNSSLLNQTGSIICTESFPERISLGFAPPAGSRYENVYGSSISPSVISTGTSVGILYGLALSLAISASGGSISNAHSMSIAGPTLAAGSAVANAYALYASSPTTTGTGTFGNSYTVSIGGPTGIGTTTPMNALDVFGSVAIGSYAGIVIAPANSVIVSGAVSIGALSPEFTLDVKGAANSLCVTAPGSTLNNQKITLAEGYDQGGFGGGSVGTNKTMCVNTTLVFDTAANVNSTSGLFAGGVFDGRYIYFSSFIQGTLLRGTFVGQLTRYDTTQPFGGSNSYAIFNVGNNVNSLCVGFASGGTFDGRYIYFPSWVYGVNGSLYTLGGQITQYDTTLPFEDPTSYAFFSTVTNLNSLCVGYLGSVFDGRYVYFVPNLFELFFPSGLVTCYDTTLPFGASASYSFFDMRVNVNSNCLGFRGGVYDGRYVYFVNTIISGNLTRYDTTLSFTSSASYSFFTPLNLLNNSSSTGFVGGVFDGRYVYFVPNNTGQNGILLRYDTTLPFGATTSYALFNTANLNSNSLGFVGGVYDGRYLYLVPSLNGQVTRYDTTQSFEMPTSYALLNTAAQINSNSSQFYGGVFDGRYIYLAPATNGQITRMDAYPGQQAIAMAANHAPNGFSVGTFAGQLFLKNGVIVGGSVGVGTPTPAYSLDVAGAVSAQTVYGYMPQAQNQLITLAQGYRSIGTNKTMSANTTVVFDTTAYVNSTSRQFTGAPFDGRYIYYVTGRAGLNNIGQITRYDTTRPFGVSSSYSIFNIGAYVNSLSVGLYSGGSFDGRYIYFPSAFVGVGGTTTPSGQLTQYDTTLPFGASSSYAFFNIGTNLSSLCVGFLGSIFDGRYIYLVSYQGPKTSSGMVVCYDTTLPFGASASYSFYNMAVNVNSFSLGFTTAVYDGRYIYFVPTVNGLGGMNGQITRYDTTLPFTASTSYSYYNTQNLNANSAGFIAGVFDGRYIYLMPSRSGQITRYDTTQPFGAPTSYAFFDTSAINSNSVAFHGGVFDGRYLYVVPYTGPQGFGSGLITRYDTTQPFGLSTSYSIFDTAANVNSNSNTFEGAVFDGRYIYFVPGGSGQITRIDAYPGAARSSMFTATHAANGFTIGTGMTNAITATTATNGSITLPPSPAGYLVFTVNGTTQKIPYYNL